MNRQDMPRRSQFSSEEAYQRARRRRIIELRRRKRRLRKIVKTAIIAGMFCMAALVVLGIGFAVKAIFTGLGSRSVSETVLAERYEAMPDISTISMEDEPTPTLDLYVCLDPGHGGYDPGTSSADGKRNEKDDVLRLALAVREELQALGAQVLMTREDDTFYKLSDRGYIANNAKVDYFVSIHRNAVDANEDATPNGIEIYVPTKARSNPDGSYELGENIMAGLEKAGISENRGVRYGSQGSENSDYQVNRDTEMPSCLIELGFMTSDKDNQLLDENLQSYAKEIARAIVKTSQKGEETEPPKGMTLENEKIQDVNSLSSEEIVWAPGTETDENNRPTGALDFQEKYGAYQAQFIMPDQEKEIYLTFDEGYEAGYTGQILDILKENGISAVFFVTLPFVKSNQELVQRMIDEGHIIGNHSANNDQKGIITASLEEQRTEINDLHDYMLSHFNYQMCLFRYPNGKFTQQSLAMVNNLNYQSVFWSFSYKDYDMAKQPKEKDSLKILEKCLHGGAIYLLSARSRTNAEILSDFISDAQKQGYTFEPYSVKSASDQSKDAASSEQPDEGQNEDGGSQDETDGSGSSDQ